MVSVHCLYRWEAVVTLQSLNTYISWCHDLQGSLPLCLCSTCVRPRPFSGKSLSHHVLSKAICIQGSYSYCCWLVPASGETTHNEFVAVLLLLSIHSIYIFRIFVYFDLSDLFDLSDSIMPLLFHLCCILQLDILFGQINCVIYFCG